tara:strand:+ start:6325 stop:7041 length:717 start_codon:yes stop_codon:yes gene_type:complete
MTLRRKVKGNTLYDTIRCTLKDHISNSDVNPGDKLPTEAELSQYFSASRPTINKALRSLARDGLIETRKRGGTIVCEQSSFSLNLIDIAQYVAITGYDYSFQIVSRVVGVNGEEHFNWKNIPFGTPVLTIECVHFSGTLPIQHERRLINLNLLPLAGEADFGLISPGGWLRRNVPWHSVEHTIGAVGAGELLARLLRIRKGTPCIGIHQTFKKEDNYLAMAELTSPAGRFHIHDPSGA